MEELGGLDAVACWSHRTTYISGEYYDTIIIFTQPNNIKIECNYKKNKALTYCDNLRDSKYSFTPNVKFLEMVNLLKQELPTKYKKAHQSALFV